MNKILSCLLCILSLQPLSAKEEPVLQEPSSVVVLGGGIGALTSALYLARAGLHPIVIEGAQPGGLITQSHAVQNWPGELEISGHELSEKLRKQAEMSGAFIAREEVTRVDFSKRPFLIETRSLDGDVKNRILQADSIVIAMGTQPNHLQIVGETGPTGYWGRGVSNCAICDGSLFRDATVGVVGGGDAAVLEAQYLSNIARQVYIFVRKDAFKGVEVERLEALRKKPNVKIFHQTIVEEIKGDGEKVTGAIAKTKDDPTRLIALDGLFLAIGSTPNSALFRGALQLDERGYIVLKQDQQTSVQGVYAIGDIVDPIYKQAISAAGDGAKAALQVQRDLSSRAALVAAPKPKEAVATRKPEVIEIRSVEQFERELSSDTPVFVDFYASWCGPCRQISPRIERSAEHLAGRVKFLKVNVDQVDQLSKKYAIRSMPTVLLFQPDGQISDRKVGSNQIADLLKTLEVQ